MVVKLAKVTKLDSNSLKKKKRKLKEHQAQLTARSKISSTTNAGSNKSLYVEQFAQQPNTTKQTQIKTAHQKNNTQNNNIRPETQ